MTTNRLAATTAIRRSRALVLLAVLTALGVTWAAVERYLPPIAAAPRLTADDAGTPGPAPGATDRGSDVTAPDDGSGSDAADEAAPAPVPEMSEADMEAQLEAIEAGAGKAAADPGERAAETPLPADLPVALPSDI